MRHVDIKTKIPELIDDIPAWERFVHLGNLLKLRQDPDGTFRHANYASGLLLYALVRHFKPTRILEIGTGRGYGAFCMAMALRDAGIDGHIVTLDMRAYDEPQNWPISDDDGARFEKLSLADVWDKRLDPQLRPYIEHQQGFSAQGMRRLIEKGNFRPQLVYIDGDHGYVTTRHDLFASLLLADSPFRILMDDYHPRSNLYGVRRVVDNLLAPVFELEAIYNDNRWHGEASAEIPLEQAPTAQVLLDSDKMKQPLAVTLPEKKLRHVVESHWRWGKLSFMLEEKRLSLRKRLGLVEWLR